MKLIILQFWCFINSLLRPSNKKGRKEDKLKKRSRKKMQKGDGVNEGRKFRQKDVHTSKERNE